MALESMNVYKKFMRSILNPARWLLKVTCFNVDHLELNPFEAVKVNKGNNNVRWSIVQDVQNLVESNQVKMV